VSRTPLWYWRLAAWLLAGGPLLWLAWRVANGDLGPNPVEFLEHYSGDWSLRLLLATLAPTPLRLWTGRAEALGIRRLLGLWAFFWVCLHFAIYLTFDLEWSARLLGAFHYLWLVKADVREPLIYLVVLAVLLGLRRFQGFRFCC